MPKANSTSHQVIVIGAGIAGLAAATEAARCGLKTGLFDSGQLGGLITNIGSIHGQPGLASTTGADLINTMLQDVLTAGVDYRAQDVKDLTQTNNYWLLPDQECSTQRVILATGANLRVLDVPGEKIFMGRGVSQCAFCDGGLYRGKNVAVIGGGDGAFQEALHLSQFCASVTMILRGKKPRARSIFVSQVADLKNIHFRWCTEVKEILGEDGVVAVRIFDNERQAEEFLSIDAVFPFIGLTAQTALAPEIASRNKANALLVNNKKETDHSGLYAIGAAQADYGGQIAHAFADAKTAAQAAWISLQTS